MKLLLKRYPSISNYTEGKLYINGVYFCDTLENKDRGLDQSMSEIEIQKKKIYGESAIPSGEYKVILCQSPRFKKILPRIMKVKGFEGILIHNGNTTKDTKGCILIGTKSFGGALKDSRKALDALMEKLKEEKEITLLIDYADYGKED